MRKSWKSEFVHCERKKRPKIIICDLGSRIGYATTVFWILKGTKFSITYFITCLLKQKQGYLEPRKNKTFHHIFYHTSFARKSKAILKPSRNKVFHHIFYHMSFAGKARLSWTQKEQSFPSHDFITCLLQERNVILNPQRYSFREVISVPKVTLMIINLNTIS